MKLIDDVGFDASFSFIFSPRPGTPAANLADDTPHEVKLARLQHLQPHEENVRASAPAGHAALSAARTQRILVEGPSRKDPQRADGPHRVQPHRQLRAPRLPCGQRARLRWCWANRRSWAR
jgi:tRNA-2-methylthio-N6-dimethylallyladenosine synthase